MQTYFRNNNSDGLILLFCGWGMDEKPFQPIKSNYDILFVSDYSELNFPYFDFLKYKKIYLIAFSAGVLIASYFQDKLPKIDLRIAVNGTLNLFDENEGIPRNVLFEMENITLENALDFRKKLFDSDKDYNLFNKYQPSRDLESSLNELAALKNIQSKPFDYDKVIIGKNDKIIPCENQLRAWKDHKNIKKIEGGHFLFYKFKDFNEIINF